MRYHSIIIVQDQCIGYAQLWQFMELHNVSCMFVQVLDKPTNQEEQKELIAEVQVTDMFKYMHLITGYRNPC
jgi:hypothetical protein